MFSVLYKCLVVAEEITHILLFYISEDVRGVIDEEIVVVER
jgi:hypothetical protein